MRITEVKIVRRDDEKLKAFATVTFDHCFVVRGLKIIKSARGLFVAMPARRKPDGTYQDVAHPIHAAARAEFERVVLTRYLQEERSAHASGAEREAMPSAAMLDAAGPDAAGEVE